MGWFCFGALPRLEHEEDALQWQAAVFAMHADGQGLPGIRQVAQVAFGQFLLPRRREGRRAQAQGVVIALNDDAVFHVAVNVEFAHARRRKVMVDRIIQRSTTQRGENIRAGGRGEKMECCTHLQTGESRHPCQNRAVRKQGDRKKTCPLPNLNFAKTEVNNPVEDYSL